MQLTGLYMPAEAHDAAGRRALRDDARVRDACDASSRSTSPASAATFDAARRARRARRSSSGSGPSCSASGTATTISYAELAARIGRPTAIRAAGAANGANPVSIMIPCHRVIGSNGSLTGYGGGLEAKRFLLELERSPRVRARATAWPARLVLLGAIWGMSFVLIKIGNRGFTPVQVSFGRMLFGLLALTPVLLAQRGRLPRDARTWTHLGVAAVLVNSAPFTLFAFGEQHVSSVLAGIWNGTTPLFVLVVVLLTLPEERPTRERALGLALGFAGVLVVLGAWRGIGRRRARRQRRLPRGGDPLRHRLPLPAPQPRDRRALGAGARIRAARHGDAAARADPARSPAGSRMRSRPSPLAAVAALGAVGTGAAYLLNYSIIRDAGATAASTVTYLVPVFATVAGVALLGERLTWNEPVGGLLVLLGVAASQGRLRLPRAATGGRRRRSSWHHAHGARRHVDPVVRRLRACRVDGRGAAAAPARLRRLGAADGRLLEPCRLSRACAGAARRSRTLRELLAGLEALGRLDRCEAVLSGYLGTPGDLERRARGARGRAGASDPTPGTSAIPCSETRASSTSRPSSCARSASRPSRAPTCSSPTASSWSGSSTGRCARVAEAVAAAAELHAAGAREVVVKGLVLEHEGRPTQHVVGLDDDGAWLARAPHIAAVLEWLGRRLHGARRRPAARRHAARRDGRARDGADGAADRPHVRAGLAGAAHGRDRLGRREPAGAHAVRVA